MKNKAKAMRNMLYGMFGAVLCMISMWLSSAYGKDNIKNGFIQSNWPKMPMYRFEAAIILIGIGVPIFYLGAKEMIKGVALTRRKRSIGDHRMVKLFDLSMHMGAFGFLFVDGCYLAMAIVYKLLYSTNLMGADIISTVEGMFYYFAVVAIAYFVIAVGGSSIAYMYLVSQSRIRVNKLCIVFNPLVMFGIGELMKLTKIYYLVDFAAAIVPFGYLLMLAAGMSHVAKLPAARRRRPEERR